MVSGVKFDLCVFLKVGGIGWWPLVLLDCVPVGVRLWISVLQHHPSAFESVGFRTQLSLQRSICPEIWLVVSLQEVDSESI